MAKKQGKQEHYQVYAALLFGVTFALLAMASVTTGFTTIEVPSGDEGTPTVTHAGPASVVAGREAPAKAWLPLAQDAMKAKNSNAVLIMVNGRSNDAGANLPLDGRCHVWTYEYASQTEDTLYTVTVRDGSVDGVQTVALSSRSVEPLLYRYGDPAIRSWTVDSDKAAAAAGEKYREIKGNGPPASAAYKLSLSSRNQLTWTVYNYDETNRVTANICVDPESGAIVHSWPLQNTGTTRGTDPTDPDTDDDGLIDGKDYDPLVFEER